MLCIYALTLYIFHQDLDSFFLSHAQNMLVKAVFCMRSCMTITHPVNYNLVQTYFSCAFLTLSQTCFIFDNLTTQLTPSALQASLVLPSERQQQHSLSATAGQGSASCGISVHKHSIRPGGASCIIRCIFITFQLLIHMIFHFAISNPTYLKQLNQIYLFVTLICCQYGLYFWSPRIISINKIQACNKL